MTAKEAYDTLFDIECDFFPFCNKESCDGCVPNQAISMALKALAKQIPQKPKLLVQYYRCPECDQKLGAFMNNYCCHCGQAIDWSNNDADNS